MVVQEINYRLAIKGLRLEGILFTQDFNLLLKEIGYTTEKVNWHGFRIFKLYDLVFASCEKIQFKQKKRGWRKWR